MQLNSTYIVHLTEDTTTKVIMYQSRGEPFLLFNLRFGMVLGRLAVLNITAINQKCATFEGSFFLCFSFKTNEK